MTLLEQIAAIDAQVATCHAVTPSKFWEEHRATHIALLTKYGIENFKRTVAHNYYNWLVTSLRTEQAIRMLGFWPVHQSMAAFTDVMELPDGACFPINGANSLLDESRRRVYQMYVSLLWDYTLANDGQGVLERIQEPLLGNPYRIWRGTTLLAQDLAHSALEFNLLAEHIDIGPDTVICELGAGNGRLAHVFHEMRGCRYVIFDIAPTLAVSQWYISNLYPDKRMFRFRSFTDFHDIEDELQASTFAFFSADQLSLFPDGYFNLFINICSLMEMRLDTIAHYMKQIDRVTRGHFYTKQWNKKHNKQDDILLHREDYPVPRSWKNILDQDNLVHPALFEQIWTIHSTE